MCEKICIPMPGEMESLNVAVAGGILMYVLKNNYERT
jgi:TrmH family RNA methyltransferase